MGNAGAGLYGARHLDARFLGNLKTVYHLLGMTRDAQAAR
jgi:hypothetical protein